MEAMVPHLPVLIVVGSILSAITILIAGWINKKVSWFISFFTLCAQFTASIFVLHHVLTKGKIRYALGGWVPPWGIEYVIDPLNAYMLVIELFLAAICLIYSKKNAEHELPEKLVSFYTIYQLLVSGLCGITVTGDIFNMYVFIEITSLSSYALIAARGKIALRASFTYLVLGSIGACFFLLGVGFLYAITGTLNMHDLSLLLPSFYHNKVVMAAYVFFLLGLSIKMALFPLHTWLPDAHAFAPAEISAMLSGIIIEVSTYAFIRISFTVFTPSFLRLTPAFSIISWVGAVAIIVGSIMAITQTNLKRMLAYSSVVNMGYIMLAVGLSLNVVKPPWGGLVPALMHILNHSLMKGCLFLVAGAFIYKFDSWHITEFNGFAKKMPFTCAAFVLAAISMIGIPPTAGFASKLYMILACLEAREFVFVFVLLTSSLLNLVYFWRVIEIIYMKSPSVTQSHELKSSDAAVKEVDTEMLIPILLLSALCLVVGILWLSKFPLGILDMVNSSIGLGFRS